VHKQKETNTYSGIKTPKKKVKPPPHKDDRNEEKLTRKIGGRYMNNRFSFRTSISHDETYVVVRPNQQNS